jgi:hypothetical protein
LPKGRRRDRGTQPTPVIPRLDRGIQWFQGLSGFRIKSGMTEKGLIQGSQQLKIYFTEVFMETKFDLKEMDRKIRLLKRTSEDLMKSAENFPSVYRNSRRILASIKMLELNISDIHD